MDTTNSLKECFLDPRCGGHFRLQQVLGTYRTKGASAGQLEILRRCIVASHLCRCAVCAQHLTSSRDAATMTVTAGEAR